MTRFLLLTLLVASSTASAIVIRDDVDDSKYRVPASEFPAFVDLPHEGHGVLIAPQWVITAAHSVTWQSKINKVVLNGIPRDVEHLVVHPGSKKLPHDLIHQARTTGDATLVMALFSTSDDIALIKLAKPVTDVAPALLHRSSAQVGQIVKIMGKGATGTGATGHDSSADASRRTQLRRAFNKITSAYDRWFCYTFDKPPAALRFEGVSSDGDSGGPVLMEVDGQWMLTGLTSWKVVQGNIQGDTAVFRPGKYGQVMCNVNLSHYIDWIEGVIHAKP
ncbi:S1 family peptidase [Lysobacter sp. A286]